MVRGIYLHLYLVMDVWSRRIVGWRIAGADSADLAAELITKACRDANVDPRGLVLHSDNGKPMRASTMITTLQWLGIVPSFSRPHVSDDNPYSEALFRTLKHTAAYPRMPFVKATRENGGSHALSLGTTESATARSGACLQTSATMAASATSWAAVMHYISGRADPIHSAGPLRRVTGIRSV
jgi:transposase InsO family protein